MVLTRTKKRGNSPISFKVDGLLQETPVDDNDFKRRIYYAVTFPL